MIMRFKFYLKVSWGEYIKRKRGLFNFVYVHRGIAKHLTRYIRVKAHATD
jgi:hypothetical protein